MSAMIFIFFTAVVALVGVAAIGWGVDSSDSTIDPREPARPSI